MKTTKHVNVKEMNFDQLFKQISPEEISDNVLHWVVKIFALLQRARKIIIIL